MKDSSLISPFIDQTTNESSNKIIKEILTSSFEVSRIIDNSKVKENIQIKSIILGNSSVGKTSILFRLFNNRFLKNDEILNNYEFNNLNIQINESKIELSFVDIPSKNTFDGLMGKSSTSCEFFILVYSIDDEDSFNNLNYWMKEIKKLYKEKNPIILLLGNKLDMEKERKISKNQGKIFYDDNDIDFFEEVSAKNGNNIDEIFNKCFVKIYKNYQILKKKGKQIKSSSEMSFEMSSNIDDKIFNVKKKNTCCDRLTIILILIDVFLFLILVLLLIKYGIFIFAYLFNFI